MGIDHRKDDYEAQDASGGDKKIRYVQFLVAAEDLGCETGGEGQKEHHESRRHREGGLVCQCRILNMEDGYPRNEGP